MSSLRILGVCSALGLATSIAWAQDAAKKPAPKPTAKASAKAPLEQADKSTIGTGRDWTLIDTNKDHSISPEEMEVWLKANPATPAK